MSSDDAPAAYETLLGQYERIANLEGAGSVLNWDQQVMMPDGGTAARSKQLSTLSGLGHELLTAEEVADSLAALEGDDLTDDRRSVVREVRREYERADAVPQSLVEEISEASSNALPVWEEARANDDFDAFAPALEELIELKREYAREIDPDRDPYEVLFEDYEPYIDLETAERVLTRLRDELVPLIDRVSDADADLAAPFEGGTFPEADQEAVSRALLDDLNYDWDRGRLDTSSHPFTAGNQFDTRITTRFDEADPLGGLTATIHEFGHATYNLGLSQDAYGSPLGRSRNLVVHESQSRFWENHVGRTRPFWDRHASTLSKHFDDIGDASAAAIYQAANRIYPENLIRVEADEITYHLHIILRFEIERDLIAGDLAVEEIPDVWNDKMEAYLGVRPDTDADGCLQDIHWCHGYFGYFPTYSLGSVLAAQLDAAVRDDLDGMDSMIRNGEFDPIREWMTDRIHRHGRRFTTPDLIEEATGKAYTADHFIDYATGKFESLYGV